jgi:hypothetical protein
MNDDELERLKLQVEMWKQTVTVQQHFNDIELRIRGFALTVLTFTLGAAALAIKEATKVHVLWIDVQLASILLVSGCLVWGVFYFVDQVWYHRLLLGAVKHGSRLEELIGERLEGSELTHRISESSVYPLALLGKKIRRKDKHGVKQQVQMHSKDKIVFFYTAVAVLLVLLAVLTQWSVKPAESGSETPERTTAPTTIAAPIETSSTAAPRTTVSAGTTTVPASTSTTPVTTPPTTTVAPEPPVSTGPPAS